MRKGNVTILASIFIMALVASVVSVGTQAWFSDVAKVGPTITAGNVDLQLSKGDGLWYNSLHFDFPTGFAPGDSYTIEVYLKNAGNAGSKTLWVYGDGLVDPNGLSDRIFITDVAFTDSTVYSPSGWTTPPVDTVYVPKFGNGVGKLTLREFATADVGANQYMRFYWGKWYERDYLLANGGSVERVKLTFYFDETAGNEYQNLKCDFNIVFLATDNQGYALIWPL